jgi:hypothetical protein
MTKTSGYEPGFVETGKVIYDEARSEYLLRTALGDFSVQDFLKTQYGSEVRITGIRVDSLEYLKKHYSESETTPST